jgi:predicted dehydrogenase
MFFEVHRLSVFTPRSLDVDVVLDLMIHDLDIVLKMAKSPVRELRAVGLPVLTGKVDIASVRIEFESGCIANFTASRISTERVRKLRFFQPAQYVSLDYSRRDVFSLSVKPTESGVPEIAPYKPQVSTEEPLRAELSCFLRSVGRRTSRTCACHRHPTANGRAPEACASRRNSRRHARRQGLAGRAIHD